ncbi:hypothetical protein BDN70DRAFT_893112 [Pholiota conissans]|uniref:Uncharacterized protein n=1 Tax=Pholiota conissans TaxID=109636 RepID=A0A9P6CWF2_9AGAR|nr:hypothetical protein BDN70DRAFT_893112 [Pholiota conissans]
MDLDYTYSTIGDLPKYLPSLTFPPSYFHRVIRTGAQTTNPIVHINISPWGEEIILNLQLLQDRVRTETTSARSSPANGRIPIPGSNNLFINSEWYGTIVVETEGTNEVPADLQDRCRSAMLPGMLCTKTSNIGKRLPHLIFAKFEHMCSKQSV